MNRNKITIHKYELPKFRIGIIPMPMSAKILDLQTIDGHPVLWAMVNPDDELVKRLFQIVYTGEEFTDECNKNSFEYIGTYQQNGGSIILHLFEKHS